MTDNATRSVSALTMRLLSPLSRNMKNSAENKLASMQMRIKMTKYRMDGERGGCSSRGPYGNYGNYGNCGGRDRVTLSV